MREKNFWISIILSICLLNQQFNALETSRRLFEQLEHNYQDYDEGNFGNVPEMDELRISGNSLKVENLGVFPVTEFDRNDTLEATTAVVHPGREKRSIGAVLFGIALVTSLTSLSLKVAEKVKGCCVYYPSACRHENRFNKRRKAIEDLGKRIDQNFLIAETQLEYVKQSNSENRVIFNELKRIAEIEEEIVKVLDANVINALNDKFFQLRRQIKEGNQTVLDFSYAQLSAELASPFDSAKGTALVFAGIGSLVLQLIIGKVVKAYQKRMALKFLKTFPEGHQLRKARPRGQRRLGVYIKQNNAAAAKTRRWRGRLSKFYNVASGVMSLLTIGLDIYSTIDTVVKCRKVRDKIKEAADKLASNLKTFQGTLSDVTKFKVDVAQNWRLVRSQTTDPGVHKLLRSVLNLTTNAANQTERIRNATSSITTFLDDIQSAKPRQVFELQKNLARGLQGVKFLLVCVKNKYKAVRYVADRCSKGEKSLTAIYSEAAILFDFNSAGCSKNAGTSYTTEAQVTEIVKKLAKTEGFQIDCAVNNPRTLAIVCTMYHSKASSASIASKTFLTLSQVQYLIGKCPPKQLTELEKTTACLFYNSGFSITFIKNHFGVTECVVILALRERSGQKCGVKPTLPARCVGNGGNCEYYSSSY